MGASTSRQDTARSPPEAERTYRFIRGPEGVDVLLGDGKARRQLVAAEALQQVGAGLQRGKQVEPAVGPAGTLAHAVFQMRS